MILIRFYRNLKTMEQQDFQDSLYIIDSYGLIYRAYYAFIGRPLTNKNGENVSAVFGFFRNLKALLDTYHPRYLVAAFDPIGPTFRHQMYKEYKATRQKTPEDLHAQIPVIETILSEMGIPVIRQDGFEADDVIATLATQCANEGKGCRILSADKDLMQLVSDKIQILKPGKTGGWEIVRANGVEAEWGVPPEKMLDLLSLIGDTADNVPGVAGVGIKTALKLLAEYGSLDEIYNHEEEITGALGNKIRNGKDAAFFSRDLIRLRYDVPVTCNFDCFLTESLDYAKAAKLLMHHGVLAVAKQFTTTENGSDKTQGLSGAEIQEQKVSGTESTGGTSLVFSATSGVAEDGTSKTVVGTETDVSFPEDEEFDTLRKNSGEYRAVTQESELKDIIDGLLSQDKPTVAFDCETDGLDPRCTRLVGFSLSWSTGKAVYIPLVSGDGLLGTPLPKKSFVTEQLQRLFKREDARVIMHNGKFDYQVLKSNGVEKICCFIWDTMVAGWLLEPDRSSYSLESLAAGKLGLETISYKDIVPKDKTFADISLETAVPYASEDADLAWQLYVLFKSRLEKTNLLDLFETLEMPVMPILAEMEYKGIHIEKEELAEYGKELSASIESLRKEIYDLVGYEFNIASTKQLQKVLFEDRKLPTGKKTKSGYSTDTEVLESLALIDPVPKKILEYRGKTKLLSTYVESLGTLADKEQRIHTSFIQTGTATGRLSSRDPNLQNIPVREEEGRRIRTAFTASPGNVLISADYSQIELVILAHLSGDKGLCAAFTSGMDVHKATAALIFGVPAENVTPDMRRTAKTINFGVMYGMSAFRLSNELGIPRAQAQSFIDKYFTTYADIQMFKEETISFAEKKGYVETLMGRRRYIRGINSRNKLEKSGAERIAVNTPIQGSAADIVKKAMLKVTETLTTKHIPCDLLLQVHDELIFECPETVAHEAAKIIQDAMEHVITLRVPLRVSVEVGPRWGDFH